MIMIVAIERQKFTYLYKYNEIRVDINQVVDKSIEYLSWMLQSEIGNLVQIFNKAVPLFEQDHEIVLIEVDKSKVKFQDGIVLSFDSVHRIYPLTKIGGQLLDGKISEDFIVNHPVFEEAIERLKIDRSMDFRRGTSKKLLVHFELDNFLNDQAIFVIELAVKKNLLDKSQPQVFSSFLDHLIGYNKTPSYIPDGHLEYICKIGAIAIKYLGKSDEVFTNGPFYKSTIKYKSKFYNKSYLTSYLDFLLIADNELKASYERMVEIISKDYNNVDVFKIAYFFLAFKSFINKNDNNIEGLYNEIHELINNDKITSAYVLSILGYTFSFETIYEGLHKLLNAPLLKSTIITSSKALEKPKIKFTPESLVSESITNLSEPSIQNEFMKDAKETIVSKSPDSIENIFINKSEEISLKDSSESVSEPIVIFDTNETSSQNSKELLNTAEIKQNTEEKITINNTKIGFNSSDSKGLTVSAFRNYILNEVAKSKHKSWIEFLEYYFPIKTDNITYEIILSKLEENLEVKNKLFSVKKDIEKIKALFEVIK
jgi:hypothetical protein